MPQSSRIPLHIYQVLEEEYISLHGQIPTSPPMTIPLPDGRGGWRAVEAARDWLFHVGHIKRPTVFAASVLPQRAAEREHIPPGVAQQLSAFDWSREKLKEYVSER